MTQSAPNTKALTSRGGGGRGGGVPPLGRPLQPMGWTWKRPGPPPELQNRVRREEGTDRASAAAQSSAPLSPLPTTGQHVLCSLQPRPRLRAVSRSQEQGRAGVPPLAWPTCLPGRRPHSWGSLDPLLPIPCDLEPKREEEQVCRRGCLPPPPEHPRALSFGWGVEWGAHRQPQ